MRNKSGQPSYQPGPGDMSQDTAKNRTEELLRRAIEAGIGGYCAARRRSDRRWRLSWLNRLPYRRFR
jgi:hypothetical protein